MKPSKEFSFNLDDASPSEALLLHLPLLAVYQSNFLIASLDANTQYNTQTTTTTTMTTIGTQSHNYG